MKSKSTTTEPQAQPREAQELKPCNHCGAMPEVSMAGELLEALDGAVVLIDDLEVEHRTPWPLDPKRWLIRAD